MAASLFALLDDIATLLDDVALMTKKAASKTAGVLGDDLAVNAQQVSGVNADRELPVVWAVARGSLINKAILVPAALAISALAPWAVTPLLMAGGVFLCFEGVEKVLHAWQHRRDAHDPAAAFAEQAAAAPLPTETEADKIKGAVRTDFILSAEIIVISLGTVADAPLGQRVAVLVSIALLMTVGVYGLVAGIVKIDDLGLWLVRRTQALQQAIGRALLWLAPWLMKLLSVGGIVAVFMVGGDILGHGWPAWHHASQAWAEAAGQAVRAASGGIAWLGTSVQGLVGLLSGMALGAVAGALALTAFKLALRLRPRQALAS